eukprot:UN00924
MIMYASQKGNMWSCFASCHILKTIQCEKLLNYNAFQSVEIPISFAGLYVEFRRQIENCVQTIHSNHNKSVFCFCAM